MTEQPGQRPNIPAWAQQPAPPAPLAPPAPAPNGWGPMPQPPEKKKHTGLKVAGGVVGAVIVIAVIATAAGGGKKGGTDSAAPRTASAAAATTSAASAKPAQKKPATAAYGDTYTYTDGLAVNVSQVEKYTPDQYAAGTHPGDEAVILTVKITNGTKKAFDTSLVSVNGKAGADGAAAGDIFDDTSGSGFSGTIVPGSSATAKFAYDIPKGATGKLDIEVQPDVGLEYRSWHWVGQMP